MSKLTRVITERADGALNLAAHRILCAGSLSELDRAETVFIAKWDTFHAIAMDYANGNADNTEVAKEMEELSCILAKRWEEAKHNYNVSLKLMDWG